MLRLIAAGLAGVTLTAGGYTLRYGDAVDAPAAGAACGYAVEKRVPTFACGRTNWPTGSVAVILTMRRVQVVRVTPGTEPNRVLYQTAR